MTSKDEVQGGAASKRSLPKAKFSEDDDKALVALVMKYGESSWGIIASQMKGRNSRQCKERWFYYLNPKINCGEWSVAEDSLLMKKYKEFGSKWVSIATFIPNRTDAQCKNRLQKLLRRIARSEKMIIRSQRLMPQPQASSDQASPISSPRITSEKQMDHSADEFQIDSMPELDLMSPDQISCEFSMCNEQYEGEFPQLFY